MKKVLASNSKVFITGILGFTGLHLAKYLNKVGAIVHGISRKKFSVKGIDDCIVHECDILDYKSLKEIVNSVQPDFIFHLAGNSSNVGDSFEKYNTNIIGTENLLKVIIESDCSAKKVIIASTASVYGNKSSECEESNSPDPVSHYAISKLEVEKIAMNYFDKIPIIVTRPFNYTGCGQNVNFLIPKIVKHFKQKRKTIELGNLDIFREFNSIEYVLDCYFKLMISKSSGKIVNICSGITYSIAEIIDFTEILTNHQINVKVNQLFVRKNEISRLRGSTDLLESLIQIDLTKTNIHSTLKQMLFDEK